jgi:hypothetical protein
MAKKNKPTQGDSRSRKRKDEEILELTDEVLSTSDEDVIELSDVVDVSSTEDEEEEMIDLTDVADAPDEEDEEIMDLSDIADDSSIQDDEIVELHNLTDESPTPDEEIVEFEDISEELLSQGEEIMELKDAIDESPMSDAKRLPASSLANEAEAVEITNQNHTSFADETGVNPDLEKREEQIELADLDSQGSEIGLDADQDQESIEETVELTDIDGEISITEAIQEPAQEDLSDAVELTDLDTETIDKELGDLAQDFKTEKLEDTVELKDLDSGVVAEAQGQIPAEETPQETIEISELDKEPMDEELNLDFESQNQGEAAEPAHAQGVQETEPAPEFNAEKIEKTIEIEGLDGQTTLDEEKDPVQALETPMESLELTESDREIIDQELHLNLEDEKPVESTRVEDKPETHEQELSLDLDIEDLDDTVDLKTTEDKPSEQIETPQTAMVASTDHDGTLTDAEPGANDDKEDSFTDSLGMPPETEIGEEENLTEEEEAFDPYKTQDVLDEIAQFDEVAPKPMHKMTDPISIKVQDPTVEEHLEIDSLEQTVEPKVDSISPEQIEVALERVITKLLSEKIERLLVEVIEKTVTKEIDKIKDVLLDETSSDGKL